MAENGELRAGVGTRTITPPIGTELYRYDPLTPRPSRSARRPMLAHAVVLERGDTRIALLSVDLFSVSRELTAETRNQIFDLTNIPPENVILCATHTHSAPETVKRIGGAELDSLYLQMLPRLFASCVAQAIDKLDEVNAYVGQATLNGLGVNRLQADGYVDTAVQTLELMGNESDYVLFNFGCKPTSTPIDDLEIDPDFPHRARAILEGEYDTAVFFQGSCGDVNSAYSHQSETARCGQMLAGATLISVGQSEQLDENAALECLPQTIQLPVVQHDAEDLVRHRDDLRRLVQAAPDHPFSGMLQQSSDEIYSTAIARLQESVPLTLACSVQVVRLGDVAIVAHPFKLFAEVALEIKRRSPFRQTFLLGLANDYLGYLTTAALLQSNLHFTDLPAYALGHSPLMPEATEVFVTEIISLLKELWG